MTAMLDVLYREVAGFYDALYRKNTVEGKGTACECDFIEEMLKRNASPVASVLDIGCGSGMHAAEMANRGYDVLAADLAEEMLQLARKRNLALGAKIEFMQADMRNFVTPREFDAIICMTNAFLCNYKDGHVRDALRCFAASLRPGGVALIEATSYPALIAANEFPYTYVDSAEVNGKEVTEISLNVPDDAKRVLVEMNTYFVANGDGTYSKHSSENRLRMLSAPRFKAFLEEAGFQLVEMVDAETHGTAGSGTKEFFFIARKL